MPGDCLLDRRIYKGKLFLVMPFIVMSTLEERLAAKRDAIIREIDAQEPAIARRRAEWAAINAASTAFSDPLPTPVIIDSTGTVVSVLVGSQVESTKRRLSPPADDVEPPVKKLRVVSSQVSDIKNPGSTQDIQITLRLKICIE